MIRLVGSGSTRSYTAVINHTGSNAGTQYSITHNLNTVKISVDVLAGTYPGQRARISPYFFDGGAQNWGYVTHTLTPNSLQLVIFKWYPGLVELSNANADVIIQALD